MSKVGEDGREVGDELLLRAGQGVLVAGKAGLGS